MISEDAENSKPNLPDISPSEAKWWESAEDHKFALEVLHRPAGGRADPDPS